MQGVYLLSGTAIFPENPELTDKSMIRLVLEDTTTVKLGAIQIAEKQVVFDSNDIAVFKYLNFDLKGFELDENRTYALTIHVDKNGNGKVEAGDFVTNDTHPVVTGLEQFQMQLTKI